MSDHVVGDRPIMTTYAMSDRMTSDNREWYLERRCQSSYHHHFSLEIILNISFLCCGDRERPSCHVPLVPYSILFRQKTCLNKKNILRFKGTRKGSLAMKPIGIDLILPEYL